MPLITISQAMNLAQHKELATWQDTFKKAQELVFNSPLVKNGTISLENANLWLTCASKLLKDREVIAQAMQTYGLTANDVRALSAYEVDPNDNSKFNQVEYYPRYGAEEVYGKKRFELIDLTEPGDTINTIMKNSIAKSIISERYNINADPELSKALSGPMTKEENPFHWMITRPTLASINQNGHARIFDMKMDIDLKNTTGDMIRAAHNVAATFARTGKKAEIIQTNVIIPDVHLNTIYALATNNQQIAAVELANNLHKINEITVEMNKQEISESLMQKVETIGSMHWNNIFNGIVPSFVQDLRSELSDRDKQSMRNSMQKYYTLHAIKEAADAGLKDERLKIKNMSTRLDLSENVSSPFHGVYVRRNDELDVNRLGQFMEDKLGVDKHLLRKSNTDIATFATDAKQGAVNINDYSTLGDFDSKKLEDVAHTLGVNTSDFKNTQMNVYKGGQSRLGIKEALAKIDSSIDSHLDSVIESVMSSPEINNPSLIADDKQVAKGLSNSQSEEEEHSDSQGLS